MKKELKEKIEERKENLKKRMNDLSVDFCADYSLYSEEYITDLFCEYADGRVDIYTRDLLEWFVENYDVVEEAIDEYGEPAKDSNGRVDILRTIQQGQFLQNERLLFEDEKEIVELLILNHLLNNEEEIEKEIDEKVIDELIEEAEIEIDSNSRIDELKDVVDNFIKKENDDE